jgi:hypothetical protein
VPAGDNKTDRFGTWRHHLQDFGVTIIGLGLFVYGAIWVHDPAVLVVLFGAGATLLGLAPTRWLNGRK